MLDNFRRLNYVYTDFSLNSVLEMAREFMTKHSYIRNKHSYIRNNLDVGVRQLLFRLVLNCSLLVFLEKIEVYCYYTL